MPLIKGKSEKAFKHNVEAEMKAGKPQAQSLAIAYATKRRAKKMAEGGQVKLNHEETRSGYEPHPHEMEEYEKNMSGKMYAKGGYVDDNHQSRSAANHQNKFRDINHVEELKSSYLPLPEEHVKHNGPAAKEDARFLNQHGEEEAGPLGMRMAHGGAVHEEYGMQDREHEMNMVDRIMKNRKMRMYSKGGQVANDVDVSAADHLKAEYDDLVLRDSDLDDADYTAENSGETHGSPGIKDRNEDIVSKVYRSWKKKDKLPNPL